jgi:hypothetical protein
LNLIVGIILVKKKRFATWKFSDTPKWFVSES